MYIIEVDKFFNQVANLKHSISLGLFSMVDNRRGASANNVTMEESHLMAQGSSPSIFAPPEQKLRSESLRQAGAKGGSGIGSSTLKNETISKKKLLLCRIRLFSFCNLCLCQSIDESCSNFSMRKQC